MSACTVAVQPVRWLGRTPCQGVFQAGGQRTCLPPAAVRQADAAGQPVPAGIIVRGRARKNQVLIAKRIAPDAAQQARLASVLRVRSTGECGFTPAKSLSNRPLWRHCGGRPRRSARRRHPSEAAHATDQQRERQCSGRCDPAWPYTAGSYHCRFIPLPVQVL